VSGERLPKVLARLTGDAAYRAVAMPSAAACEACVALLGVSGAQLTLTRGTGRNAYSYATNQIGTLLENMRFVLGEGPCEHSLRSGLPVLVEDLDSWENHQRWPLFTLSAGATGTRAMFVFPLRSGAISLGALVLHRTSPGPLTSEQLADAYVVADVILSLVLDELTGVHVEASPPAGMPLRHTEVHQATGMLSVQLGVSMNEALVRLCAHSFAQDMPVVEVARDIVTRHLRLSPDGRSDPR
jgi:hypothetical protein